MAGGRSHHATNCDSNADVPGTISASLSTAWHRDHGRPSRNDKAISQQYLTPQEEKALVDYVLRAYRNGYPLPVRALRSHALVIARQRSSLFQVPGADDDVRPPGKNWPQAFYTRHPELKSRRVRALDWSRHGDNIYEKVVRWFSVIGPELHHPEIVADNIYNMDETGVLLSALNSLKVLVSSDDLSKSRGAGVHRTLITAVECVSASGRSLPPLIIWPATTHRSNWTTHPTPGWHFAASKTGYTDTEISLYWVQKVFDPATRSRAQGRPRILINDGFATHESLDLMTFCFENNIILCRLPSHTSHKLQPCDVGVFGPLKTAYREQVERLYRGGANTVGKQHFTLLYSRARDVALTPHNIKSGWMKAGLFPFNPDRVLQEIDRPKPQQSSPHIGSGPLDDLLPTPVTAESLASLRKAIGKESRCLDAAGRHRLQKLGNAAEKAIADRTLLAEENRLLFDQNNEKTTRSSTRSTVVGVARIMSYDDILEAQKARDAKTCTKASQSKSNGVHQKTPKQIPEGLPPHFAEREKAHREIDALGLKDYCSIVEF